MRICIYGAGVIGSILAGHFARAGHEVSAVARGSQLDAIRTQGLTVANDDETFAVKIAVSDQPADLGKHDLIIVATKAPSHGDVADAIGPLLGPGTLVGFAVNGIFWFYGDGFAPGEAKLDLSFLDPAGKLRSNIGAERAMGIVCFSGGAMTKPGTVHMTRPNGRFIMGAALPDTAQRAGEVISALDVAGLTIETAPEIRWPMWKKFVTVASNQAVSSLTCAPIGQNQGDRAVREINIAL
ncbi:MAG: 2-dehydropantoate 2-reductase, partial [Alphaproteobacteria bacterium]